MTDKTQKLSRWYFGGLSSAGAACVTHPLDLLKVHLQTQQEGKISVLRLTTTIIRKQGILALYNGLSASLLRQLTYSTMRFGAYEMGKQTFETPGHSLVFSQKLLLAGVSGAVGGVLGTPADLINVRMQNDIKVSPEHRRNYKHALDGIVRVIQQEGVGRLFSGCSTATLRAALMTIGQLSFYDQVKITLLQSGYFKDTPVTHVVSSVFAGAVATTLTQPLDVLKTRAMNAKLGEFKSLADLFLYTAKLGPLAFFKLFPHEKLCIHLDGSEVNQWKSISIQTEINKVFTNYLEKNVNGYVPAFVRLAPQTILTFVFLEQLRSNFGFYPYQVSSL